MFRLDPLPIAIIEIALIVFLVVLSSGKAGLEVSRRDIIGLRVCAGAMLLFAYSQLIKAGIAPGTKGIADLIQIGGSLLSLVSVAIGCLRLGKRRNHS